MGGDRPFNAVSCHSVMKCDHLLLVIKPTFISLAYDADPRPVCTYAFVSNVGLGWNVRCLFIIRLDAHNSRPDTGFYL